MHSFAVAMVTTPSRVTGWGAPSKAMWMKSLALLRDSLIWRSERQAILGLRGTALLKGRNELSVAIENLSMTDPSQRANALE